MKYKVAIWEEISGYIDVEAESKEKAEEEAFFLMDEYGCNKIFHPYICRDEEEESGLIKYNGDNTHRKTEVLTCEEVNEEI